MSEEKYNFENDRLMFNGFLINFIDLITSTQQSYFELENRTTNRHLSFKQALKTMLSPVVYSPIGYLSQHARIYCGLAA